MRASVRLFSVMLAAVAVVSCSHSPLAPGLPTGLTFAASTILVPDDSGGRVLTIMTIVNRGASTDTVTYSEGCPMDAPVLLRGYLGEATTASWDYEYTLPGAVCLGAIYQASLAPRDSVQFHISVEARSILGDSLPAGSYRFVAYGTHVLPNIAGAVVSGTLHLGP